MGKIIFKIELKEHEPKNKTNPCNECVLCKQPFACFDRSYCKVHETGKTWIISKQIRNKPPKEER